MTPFLAKAFAYSLTARWKLLPSCPVEIVIDRGAAGRTKCSTAQVATASASEIGRSVTRRSRQETPLIRGRNSRLLVHSTDAFSQTQVVPASSAPRLASTGCGPPR